MKPKNDKRVRSEREHWIVNDPDRPRSRMEMAAWMQKSPRTIERYMKIGMPYIDIGSPMFHLPSVIAWLVKNQRSVN